MRAPTLAREIDKFEKPECFDSYIIFKPKDIPIDAMSKLMCQN
jgi:hypothetical protein